MPNPEIIEDRPQYWLLRVYFAAKNDECAIRPRGKMSEKISVRSISC